MRPGTGPRTSGLPPPVAVIEVRLDDEVTAPVRRYGNPDGPRLLLSHGNGLAIDLYYPFWSLLLDDFDVIVFDLRNHGANPLGDPERHTVPALCRDLEAVGSAVDRDFGVRPRAGVYHSVSCLAALLSPSVAVSYAALVLFDPTPLRAGGRPAGLRVGVSSGRDANADSGGPLPERGGLRRAHERPAGDGARASGGAPPDGGRHAAPRRRQLRPPLPARVRGEDPGSDTGFCADGGPGCPAATGQGGRRRSLPEALFPSLPAI